MRRRSGSALVALATSAVLVLTACGSGEGGDDASTSATPTASESASSTTEPTVPAEIVIGNVSGFTATGAFGEKPVLTFGSDVAPDGLQVEVISEGTGPIVGEGAYVQANYLGQVWGSDNVFDNSYDKGTPTGFLLSRVVEGWGQGLAGQRVGSRVMLTIPADLGYGPNGGNPDAGIGAEDVIVFVVDIVEAINLDAVGQADAAPTGAELPVTYEGALGAPVTAVTVAEGAVAPTELSVTVIATGSGAPLVAGDYVGVQLAATSWDNTQFQETWSTAGGGVQFSTMGQGSVFDSLIGVPAGSRVLLQAASDAASGSPAVAVVIDVVGAISG